MDIRAQRPEAGVLFQETRAQVYMNRESLGTADIYITEDDVRFVGENIGILLQYSSISVHAITRDESSFPHSPAVFLLVNEESVNEVDEPTVCEYHIVPGRNEHLEEFYDALCEGQTLNPDKEEGSEGDEEEPIDLRNFTWADGYGPDFLTGASGGQTLGPSGDQNPSTTAFNNLRIADIPVYDPNGVMNGQQNGNESEDMEDDGRYDDPEE